MPEPESPTPAKIPPPPSNAVTKVPPSAPAEFRGLLEGMDGADGVVRPEKGGKTPREEMSFLDHLEELRMTILKAAGAALIGMALVGSSFVKFFDALRYPLVRALGESVAETALISPLEPMGSVMMVINVSLFGGLVLALPIMAYFVIRFVAPGLTLREKGMLWPAMAAALCLFALGSLGCFFFLLPAGLHFSYEIDQILHLETKWSARYYYSLVAWAVFGTGLVFEFPLVLVILQVLGVVETKTLRGLRRHAVLVILIVGGFIAPSPDIFSMLMMAVPMQLLFEASLIVGPWLRQRHVVEETQRAERAAAERD